MNPAYQFTEEDIKALTKPSRWRDYLNSNFPGTIEEYTVKWNKAHLA
jgi:hypothetical protein